MAFFTITISKKMLYLISTLGCIICYANIPIKHTQITQPIDKIIIEKSQRKLFLLRKGEIIKTYRISLGANPIGNKEYVGDHKTPEGSYVIDYKKPDSAFHLALHISYPSLKQIEIAKNNGYDSGGMIMIHGLKNGLGWIGRLHRFLDWTDGCIAVTNPEIEEIYQLSPQGTSVEIRP